MTLILLGDIAAGKSTQAKMLVEKYGLRLIDAPAYSRKLAREKVEGAVNRVERGFLTKTELIQDYLKSEITSLKPHEGVLIDGGKMPEEASLIYDLFSKQNRKILVLYLTLPLEESRKRIAARGRPDDTEQAIRNRIDYYQKIYSQTVKFWQGKGLLKKIDGNQPVGKVTRDIIQAVERYYGTD